MNPDLILNLLVLSGFANCILFALVWVYRDSHNRAEVLRKVWKLQASFYYDQLKENNIKPRMTNKELEAITPDTNINDI